jgi:hypothetical protein
VNISKTKVKIADLQGRRKDLAKKAAAAYLTFENARKVASKVAERFPTHTFHEDYDYDSWAIVNELAIEHRVRFPGAAVKTDNRGLNRFFESSGWTPLHIPGLSPFIQARREYGELTFRAPRAKDIEALVERVSSIKDEQAGEEPEFDPNIKITPSVSVYHWDKDMGGWDCHSTRSGRSFHSVLLPPALQAEIEADLRKYGESRERLQRLELPWRRGYLFEGPPGTGKTSLSLAVAASLNFNLATLSLTDIESDGELRGAVSRLPRRTVLVIEDIDAYDVSRDRNHNAAKDGALSLSGLLNSLDGFETPDGLVTIATTNHVEHLDEALIRSGRLDRTFKLDYIQSRELERLFKWFYEKDVPSPAPEGTFDSKLAPAEATELFKQHLEDPDAGWAAVLERINGTTTALEVAA